MSSPLPLREAAVAGRFYPASAADLTRTLNGLIAQSSYDARRRDPEARRRDPEARRRDPEARAGDDPVGGDPVGERPALLALVPHAGYIYSGRIAGAIFARLDLPEHVLVLCPNHTGLGLARALWCRGAWRTPLGDVEIAQDLTECLMRHAPLDDDQLAHVHEHAIEVELPFLQQRAAQLRIAQLRIAPLCLQRLELDECLELGEALARGIEAFGQRVLIVCSSDMSHYIPADLAADLDRLALDQVEALNASGLYRTVIERRISMCGFIPTTVGLAAARALGATRAHVLEYGNSGETSGDFGRVVGYAGALVT